MVRQAWNSGAVQGIGRWLRQNTWLLSVLALAAQGGVLLYNQGRVAGALENRLNNIEATVNKIETSMVTQEKIAGLLREAEVTHASLKAEIEVERRQRVADVDGLRVLIAGK